MKTIKYAAALLVTALAPLTPVVAPAHAQAAVSGYDALLALYTEFRAFVPPAMVKGVPDYSPAAVAVPHWGLTGWA